MAETTKNGQKKEKAVYAKEQILASKRFRNRSDLLDALLEEGKSYTLEEAEKRIETYLKGRVS